VKDLFKFALHAGAYAAGVAGLGVAFYYFGNLPGLKQAQQGLNGTTNPIVSL